MKKILAAGALFVLIASPALAQNGHRTNHYSRANPAGWNQTHDGMPENTVNGPNGTVIQSGRVVGQDPDANVRTMIGSDPEDQQ